MSEKFRNKLGAASRDIDKVKVVLDDQSKLSDTTENFKDYTLVGGKKLTLKLKTKVLITNVCY